jgi:hypothetical protein
MLRQPSRRLSCSAVPGASKPATTNIVCWKVKHEYRRSFAVSDPFEADEDHDLNDIAYHYQTPLNKNDAWHCHMCRDWVWTVDIVGYFLRTEAFQLTSSFARGVLPLQTPKNANASQTSCRITRILYLGSTSSNGLEGGSATSLGFRTPGFLWSLRRNSNISWRKGRNST